MDTKPWRMLAAAFLLTGAAGVCTAAEDDSVQIPDTGRSGPVVRDKLLYACILGRRVVIIDYAKTGGSAAGCTAAASDKATSCMPPEPTQEKEQRALRCLRDFGYLEKDSPGCKGKQPLCPMDTSPVCKAGKWTCQGACMSEPPRCKSGTAVCGSGGWKCPNDSTCQGEKPVCRNGQLVCDTRCGNGWCSYVWDCHYVEIHQQCSGAKPACLFGAPSCQSGSWKCSGAGSPLAPTSW
jgi:hypothetical protein